MIENSTTTENAQLIIHLRFVAKLKSQEFLGFLQS